MSGVCERCYDVLLSGSVAELLGLTPAGKELFCFWLGARKAKDSLKISAGHFAWLEPLFRGDVPWPQLHLEPGRVFQMSTPSTEVASRDAGLRRLFRIAGDNSPQVAVAPSSSLAAAGAVAVWMISGGHLVSLQSKHRVSRVQGRMSTRGWNRTAWKADGASTFVFEGCPGNRLCAFPAAPWRIFRRAGARLRNPREAQANLYELWRLDLDRCALRSSLA